MNRLLFFDHDLQPGAPNGLDLVQELGLEGSTTLITGRHDDPAVQRRCKQLGIRILPKSLVATFPIRRTEENLHLGATALREVRTQLENEGVRSSALTAP